MNTIAQRIQKEFSLNTDLITKTININMFKKVYIIFLETLCSADRVNDYILKPIILNKKKRINKQNITNFIAGPNTIKIGKNDTIEYYLTNGFTIIILDNNVYAVETKADITRSIAPSEVQTSVNGPKDSFTENYQINIGLIKRRLKSSSLKIEKLLLGRKTNTIISIIYFDDIAKKENVEMVKKRLEKIDIDGIVDSSTVSYLLDGENNFLHKRVWLQLCPHLVHFPTFYNGSLHHILGMI